MPTYPWIEIPLALVAVVGPLLVVVLRLFCTKKTTHKDGSVDQRSWGIGVRMIGVLRLIPIVALMTLEGKRNQETGGALIGVALGYTLSGIEKAVPKN